jgi:hypothetical protein
MARFQLAAAGEMHLALLTAGVANERVVRAACAGRLFFCMSSATVPDTFSEGGH